MLRTLLALLLLPASALAFEAVFPSREDARAMLVQRDEFLSALSPFDIEARLKTDQPASLAQLQEHIGKSVQIFGEAERARIASLVDALQPRLRELKLPLPKQVWFIVTSGAEEGRAAYTRGHAIVLPEADLRKDDASLSRLIAHELFHVASRHQPHARDRWYATVGFVPCSAVALPAELERRRITNPDAPFNGHCIRVRHQQQDALAMPRLIANREHYDPERGGEFFEYLDLRFSLQPVAEAEPGGALADFAALPELEGFFDQVGSNTQYLIHPEEIIADHFALLATSDPAKAPSKEPLEALRRALAGGSSR